MSISEEYKIVKRVGNQRKRKFGELFLVESKATGTTGLLKAIRKTEGSDLAVERLRAEAGFDFNFDGLPKTLLFEETETEVFLVRNYCEGRTLDVHWSELKRRNRIEFIRRFLEKLSPILTHLKENSVVHCDLKPGNFIIEEMDSDFNVHLIDFGLAIRTNEFDANSARSLLFPLGFAAPELLLNHLDIVDHRTDIFALGITIWKLYAEKLPLTHPNPSIFTNLQLTHPLPEHAEIPNKLFKILQKMCVKHSFELPPNRMDQEEVKIKLSEAMKQRYSSLDEVIAEVKLLEKRKRRWF